MQRKTHQEAWGLAALDQRRKRTQDHLAAIALRVARAGSSGTDTITICLAAFFGFWWSHEKKCYRFVVAPAISCCRRTKRGKGTDICAEIVEIAQQRNPSFDFAVAFPDKEEFRHSFRAGARNSITFCLTEIGDTVDVLQAFRNLKPLCRRHTRLLVTTYNHLWEPLVTFAEWIGMKVPRTEQNWLSTSDIRNLLKLAGFEALETHRIVILPKYVPLVISFP